MAQPTFQGLFIWQELLAEDPAAAQEFYQRVIGWQAKPHDSQYTLLTTPKGAASGVMRLPDEMRSAGAKPHWLPYIGATDIDATVAHAQQLGAKIFKPPTAIENVGRYAVLADPQGAKFGVFTPGQPGGAPRPTGSVGEYAWFELATSDADAAFRFYSELFGWKVRRDVDLGAMGNYRVYGVGDVDKGMGMGGIYNLGAANQGRVPQWLSYVAVEDADATAAAVRAAGGSVVHGPSDVPGGGRIVQMLDRQGVLFAVFAAPKAAAKAKPAAKPAAKTVAKPAATTATAAAKKAPAKPVAEEKPAAQKTVAKKPAAKKTAAKKAAVKRPAAGKASARGKTPARAGGGARKKASRVKKTVRAKTPVRGRAAASGAAARKRSAKAKAAVRGKSAARGAVRRKAPVRAKKKSRRWR